MFEYVDKFKIGGIFTMTFTVKKLEAVEHVIGVVFVKQSKKTPKKFIKLAKTRLEVN